VANNLNISLITEASWYENSKVVHLFIHLLTKVAHEKTIISRVELNKGQVLTSRSQLSFETGLSEQSIRSCLKILTSTNESTNKVTSKPTNQYSILTICGYDNYFTIKKKSTQRINQQSNQQTNQQKIEEKPIEVETQTEIHTLRKIIEENYPRVSKLEKQLTDENCEELLSKYPQELIIAVIENMENSNHLKNYKSVFLTLKNWIKREKNTSPTIPFEESAIYNRHIFAQKFVGWDKEKLKKYYEKAMFLSGEGKKYINWEGAIRNWESSEQGIIKSKQTNGKEKSESRLNAIINYGVKPTTNQSTFLNQPNSESRIIPDSGI
jgi:hypothetical protein